MDWQATSSIFSGLGVFAVVVGVLLRFKVGRWLLGALWLLITLGSLLSGDLHGLSDNPDVDGDLNKISRYWLIGGGICFLLGLVFRALANHSI